MAVPKRENALDHVVVLMFENRSFDHLLGRLYEPGEVASFEGVIGKDLSNPIPPWAEHGADRGVVRYGVAKDMNTPYPDPGEELPHINTQLFGQIDPPSNRGVPVERMVAPYSAPADPDQVPTMDGFVTDYISAFTAEMGRQPSYDEYSQIMTGYTPELPTYAFIEPQIIGHDHNDMHPAYSMQTPGLNFDPPSSLIAGEDLLARTYNAIRSSSSAAGSNHLNTLFMVVFDEHGGTYDHVPPPVADAPDPSAPAGQMDFTFSRLGVRLPAIAISPWIPEKTVVNETYRNTSMIRTMRERWNLGPPLTARDADAPTSPSCSRSTSREYHRTGPTSPHGPCLEWIRR